MKENNLGLSKKQQQIYFIPKLKNNPYKMFICDGSIRSGKTSIISISFLEYTMDTYNQASFIIGGNTSATVKKNVIVPLMRMSYMKKRYNMKYSGGKENTFTVTSKHNKNHFNTYYIYGGSTNRSQDAVQGLTASGMFIDEAALVNQDFLNQCMARCSVDGALMFFSCNPRHPKHWFNLEFIQKAKQKKALYLKFTMDDNPGLSEERKEYYKSLYDGVFYARNILGQWVNAEGSIYNIFSNNHSTYLIDKLPNERFMIISCGMDFGGTASGHTFVCTGITRNFEMAIVLEAERYDGHIDPDELENIFSKFCTKVYEKYGQPFKIYCDNAEPMLIRGFYNRAAKDKLHAQVKGAIKSSILGRIKMELKLLKQKRLFLMKDTTKPLQDGFDGAMWVDNSAHPSKEDERMDNGTSDIDIMDAFEYSITPYLKKFDLYRKVGK